MCYADKFYFCISLELGCLIIGFSTFVFGSMSLLTSITFLFLEQKCPGCGVELLHNFPKLVVNSVSINFILSMFILSAAFLAFFSLILLIGIRKNKSSYVLSYFAYGITLSIISLLCMLLLLIHGHWEIAISIFIVIMNYIHCLVVVNSTYELILAGTRLKFSERQDSDETLLVE